MIVLANVLLVAAATCFVVRVVIGPTLADRIVALDGFIVTLVAAILVDTIRRGTTWFVDVALVVGFVGFVGTLAGARYVERRGS